MPTTLNITGASVKVMRSHDYCHFEVCLSSDTARTDQDVDDLRKSAARLADKAVEQYKVAKANAALIESDEYQLKSLTERARRAEEKPESERTPKEKAEIKFLADGYYRNRRRFDYEDDFEEQEWDEDYEHPDDDPNF